MDKLFQILNAIIFLGIGVICLVKTNGTAETLRIAFTQPEGATDFRATYAGMCLAVGALFALAALWRPDMLEAAHWLALFTYAGLASVRLFGIVYDGGGTTLMYSFLATEVVFTAWAAYLLRGN